MNWYHFTYSGFAYSHFACLLPLSAISPTHAKYDQNNVKQLIQLYELYNKEIKRPKSKFKWQYEQKFL